MQSKLHFLLSLDTNSSAPKMIEVAMKKESPKQAFLNCEKHLLIDVTLRLSYRRSHEDFLVISENAAKHYKLQILEANYMLEK